MFVRESFSFQMMLSFKIDFVKNNFLNECFVCVKSPPLFSKQSTEGPPLEVIQFVIKNV